MGDLEPTVEGPETIITARRYPAITFALNIRRCDSGGPHWPSRDECLAPLRWAAFLPAIERGLASLDGGELNHDLDGEMWTFCAGDHSDMQKLIDRSSELALANLFLNDFFDQWTLFDAAH